QPLDEVEAHAPDAVAVESLELIVGERFIDEGHTLGPAIRGHQRIDQGAVVGVVAGRLHDNRLVEAEEVMQCKQLLLRRVARRVFALGCERELGLWAEYVVVRVHGACRRLVLRLRRIGMKRNVAGAHRQGGVLHSRLSYPRMRASGDRQDMRHGGRFVKFSSGKAGSSRLRGRCYSVVVGGRNYTRSIASERPWPTPMHMVASAR